MENRSKIQRHFFFERTTKKREMYNQVALMAAHLVAGLQKPTVSPYIGDTGTLTMDEAFGFDWA